MSDQPDQSSAHPAHRHHHHHTAPRDRVPWVQLIAFGLGGFVPIALFNSVTHLSGLIVNVGLGVSAVLVGVAQMIPRLWDAFTDPLMGHISDNTRTPWGRRRPYILVGGIAVAATFVLMWAIPRDWSDMEKFYYFLLTSLMFYTAVTVFEIPHGALGMEMTPDYHERTKLFSVKSFVGNVGAIITPWFYAMANWDFFKGPGGDEVDGMRKVAWLAGAIVIALAVSCAAFCRERQFKHVRKQDRVPLRRSMATTLKNRTFLMLVATIFAIVLGFNFVQGFTNYIAIFYLFGGDKQGASVLLGWTGTAWAITAVIAVFPLNWISRRMGKTSTLLIAVGLMAGGQILKLAAYNPAWPYLLLVPMCMIAAGMLFFFTLAAAMVADVCDEDELETGTRSEGAYYSVFWWFMKLGMAGAYFVAGLLIEAAGFDEDASVQSEGTLLLLRVFDIAIPIFLCVISTVLLVRYPLSEARAYEVKAALERRKGEAAPCPSCGCDVRGVRGGVCPECGEALPEELRGDPAPGEGPEADPGAGAEGSPGEGDGAARS